MVEKGIFVVLLAVFCWLFWTGISPKLRVIFKSRPLAKSRFSEWPVRIRRFVAEVIFQWRVIRHRPLVGVMHAFVFGGFLLFAAEILNHITKFFGWDFLPADCWYREVFLKWTAVFTLVGILFLGIRRFVFRPKALGKLDYMSGSVVVLIALSMITFLLDFWWLHSLAILGLLFVVPRSIQLHRFLAPLAVFFRAQNLAELPRLDMEKEEFGLSGAKDLDWKNALDVFSCVECGRCQDRCPAFNTGKELNPKELVLDVQKCALAHRSEDGHGPTLSNYVSPAVLWQCTTCGACENVCPSGVEHLPLIIGMRRGRVAEGDVSPRAAAVLNSLERGASPWGLPLPANFSSDFKIPEFKSGMEYLLWTGCAGLVDDRYQKVMAATVGVLKAANIDFGAVELKPVCGGDLARRLGNELVFEQIAAENIELLKSLNSPKIITACPHCYRTLGRDYRGLGGDFRVFHHSQIIDSAMDKLWPQLETSPLQVTYHDPCYLGRYGGVYDAPRRIIKDCGSKLIELPRSGTNSFCCGAGGGRMFLEEEKGKAINVERAREIVATKMAWRVVTGCPFCLTMLKDGLAALSQNISVDDVAEFVWDSILQKRKEA